MNEEELIVDVVVPSVTPSVVKNSVIKRSDGEMAGIRADGPFEAKTKVDPVMIDDEGKEVAFDPRRHVSISISDAVRTRLNSLVGKTQDEASVELNNLIVEKKINSVRFVRLTETLDGNPEPGRVTVILNFDKSVNAIDVE